MQKRTTARGARLRWCRRSYAVLGLLGACSTRTYSLDDRVRPPRDAELEDGQVRDPRSDANTKQDRDDEPPITTTHPLPDGLSAADVTYYQHAKAVFDARCVACHREPGVGPFALETFAQARALSSAVHDVVSNEVMPPFPADDDACQALLDARNMPDAERAILEAWSLAGAPEGNPDEKSQWQSEPIAGVLGPATDSIPLTESFALPAAEFPRHRCFVVDPMLTTDTALSAVGVAPTNARAFRHALVHLALPGSEASLALLEAADAEGGYDCYYSGGFSGAIALADVLVGASAFAFPDNTTVTIPAGSRLVVELDQEPGRGADMPAVSLWRAAAPATRSPSTFFVINTSFVIPKGAANFTATARGAFVAKSATPKENEAREGRVWGVAAHMYLRGKSARVELRRADGTRECLLSIPAFTTRWEGGYRFAEPIRANAGDTLHVECNWDNSEARQPVVDGKRLPSRDLTLGTSVLDETCVGSILMSEE